MEVREENPSFDNDQECSGSLGLGMERPGRRSVEGQGLYSSTGPLPYAEVH